MQWTNWWRNSTSYVAGNLQPRLERYHLTVPQVASRTFGLSSAVADCCEHTTLDDFATSLLVPGLPSPPPAPRSASFSRPRPASDYFVSQPTPPTSSHLRTPQPISAGSGSGSGSGGAGAPRIAGVVLAKHLDRAPKAVQLQALELVRTRRIFTRTAVQAAPRPFLVVAVLGAESGGGPRLTPHLNDLFHLAHWHDPDDGFANLDEGDDAETASTVSVVKRKRDRTGAEMGPADDKERGAAAVFSEADIASLARASTLVKVDVEVLRYQMNIVSFLRMHRAVASGITPVATKHFEHLVKCLAPLHRLDYVTPSLVALAAKKVYQHRIRIVVPEKERSMQWGSELAAVQALVDGVASDDVIEDVLGMVSAPL